jgi:hypothetical protein
MKLHRLHIRDLSAGISSFGFSRIADAFVVLLRTRIAAKTVFSVIAGAVVLLAAGAHLQGAPVANADIVRLLEAGMPEQVIVQAIAAGQPNFDLSPDALIVLKNKGATPGLLSAMLATAQPKAAATPPSPQAPTGVAVAVAEVPPAQPAAPGLPAPSAPPVVVVQPGSSPVGALSAPGADPLEEPPAAEPSQVSLGYFQGQLAPYGNWVQLAGYGWCWQPTVASQNVSWRPYFDAGHWAYTDQGWFWASEYPWGDVVFHYGRWARQPGYGWIWVPDYTWGPSWVAWRHGEAEGFIGWAPLPPSARFIAGVGLSWRGRVDVNADFGLGPADFCFVESNHFWEHDFRGFLFRPERAEFYWRHSVIRNGYRFYNGRFIVEGLGAERIAALTRHPVRAFEVREMARQEQHDHFFARRGEVVRHVEARREAVRRNDVHRQPIRPGDKQRQDGRGDDNSHH